MSSLDLAYRDIRSPFSRKREYMTKPLRLTSLLLVEERLLEASYFVSRLGSRKLDTEHFKYELNAFLTASRSVPNFVD